MKAAVLKFLASLPESIPFVEAVSLGYRCMTSLHGMLDQARRRQGNESRYTAVGEIGLAAVHITALDANVIAMDINDTKPRGTGGEGSLPVGNLYQQQ